MGMIPNRFSHYLLRTTDVEGARAFYAALLGRDISSGQTSVGPLPAAVAARGAPSHWLGQISVSEVEATKDKLIANGAQQLGPVEQLSSQVSFVNLRDPFGAILRLGPLVPELEVPSVVGWHAMLSQDHVSAIKLYGSWFGWCATEQSDLGPELGTHQSFAWQSGGKSVGSMSNLALRPGIHPQWLHFFCVPDLDSALRVVEQRGGTGPAQGQATTGGRLAACEDPQGAAFGLMQARDNTR
jgi:predicted enzyme related to lactoylglutathione lyase